MISICNATNPTPAAQKNSRCKSIKPIPINLGKYDHNQCTHRRVSASLLVRLHDRLQRPTHHSGLRRSLLRLEENCILVVTLWALLSVSWEGWVTANILGDTSSLANSVVQDVAEDAGRDSVLSVLAGTAGKLKLVGVCVLLWVEHVGATDNQYTLIKSRA